MAELTVKEAEKLRTALQQNLEVHDAKPWGFLTGDAKTALLTRWKANQGVLPEPLRGDPATHNGEQFVQLITLLYTRTDEKADGSAQVQLEQLWKDLDFSYRNYDEVENRVLMATKLIAANAMDPSQQKDTIVRIVKSTEASSRDKHHFDETKKILERLKGHQASFQAWSDKLLELLVSNRQKVKELRDCGIKIFNPIIEKKRAIDPASDPEPDPEPRT
jgi:hypothetical protein